MDHRFDFLIYKSADENISINAIVKDETIWLTQKAMAELFDVEVPAISKHLSNIYKEGELEQNATVSKMEIVRQNRVSDQYARISGYSAPRGLARNVAHAHKRARHAVSAF